MPHLIQPLPGQKDDIIYYDADPNGNVNDVWALSLKDGEPFLVMSGVGIIPGPWSPLSKHWLIYGKESLYLADPSGNNIHRIFQDGSHQFFLADWLSENIIFISAYYDLQDFIPDMYKINIDTGEITTMNPGDHVSPIAICPFTNAWIGYDGSHTLIVDQLGRQTLLPENMQIHISPFRLNNAQFIPDSDEFVYQDRNRNGLWLSSLSNPANQTLFPTTKDLSQIDTYQISPDGKFIGITFRNEDTITPTLQVIEVDTGKVISQFPFPYAISDENFVWSPDSNFIAFYYQSAPLGSPINPGDVYRGLQILNLTTGEIKVLVKKDLTLVD